MADQLSVGMLAFIFAARTIEDWRLTQTFSKSLSVFSCFKRDYLNPVIKANQCAQKVDDIGFAAKVTRQLIWNLRAVFKCIKNSRLKLFIAKCHFRTKKVYFHRRTVTSNGVNPQKRNITKFWKKFKFIRPKKALQDYIGLLKY